MQVDQYSSVRDELIMEQSMEVLLSGEDTVCRECTLCNFTVTCTGLLYFLASFSLWSEMLNLTLHKMKTERATSPLLFTHPTRDSAPDLTIINGLASALPLQPSPSLWQGLAT